MQDNDHNEYHAEDRENLSNLACKGHIRKDAHDMDGQKRDNNVAEKLLNDNLKILEEIEHATSLEGCYSQT